MIVDLFCGAGGWAEGLRQLQLDSVGFDIDPWACRSHQAAGHATIRADVAAWALPPLAGRVEGLVASPPCTAFSQAGSRAGIEHVEALIAAAHDGDWTARPDPDPLVWLPLEPGRWIAELRPRWVALEQVPPVMPLWRAYQHALGELGYATWAGVLNAADYGIVSPCPLHATATETPVETVERGSRIATERVFVVGATTPLAADQRRLALTVVARLVSPISRAFAAAATCDERAAALLQLARSALLTRDGRAADEWTSEVTSAFGWTGDTAESIASWLRVSSDDLSGLARSSTTLTGARTTTIRAISRSIAATLTTGLHTGPASRSDGCGLCVDAATPQTRQRAILLARAGARAVGPPEPTHSDQRKAGDLFGRPRWVSMAEALGWLGEDDPARTVAGHRAPRWAFPDPGGRHGRLVGFPRRDDRGDSPSGYRERDWRGEGEPAFAVTEKARSWVVNTGRDWKEGEDRSEAQRIPLSEPAPALVATGRWFLERPATTVAGDTRIQPPGHKQNASDPPGRFDGRAGERAIRVTVEDALALQSFPRGYPLQGSKTAQFTQVGNAIPPLLAAALCRAIA